MSDRRSTDTAVVTRAKAGDAEAWRELYEHIGGRLVVWLRAQPSLDVALDADDIAHDAWVVAADRVADFHGGADDFTGWLFGIARNLILNANRRNVRRATSSLETTPRVPEPRTDEQSSRIEQLEWTRRMLAHLPPREAQVVACRDVVGLDVATTAATLGIGAPAVRVAHHRGLRRLRALVESGGPEAERITLIDREPTATPPIGVGSWS